MLQWFNFSTFPQGLEFPCGCNFVIVPVQGGFEVLVTSPGNTLPVRPVVDSAGKKLCFHTYREASVWASDVYYRILNTVGDLPPSIRPNRMN